MAGLPCVEFHTAVYDLLDTGLAIVHLDGGQVRPAGIMAVVPRNRHQLLRNDFAFELMTVVSFLGAPINSGCELEINDYMEQALRMEPLATQIFAIETAELSADVGIVLSAHFENLAAAMLDWLARRDLQADGVLEAEEYEECVTLPGRCAALTARRVAG